ncbi:MAG: hypothetical protein JNK92_05870 [Dechloromonas sp.]|nr:hypothetical protein [Dechloromonas sp.]
MSTELQKLQSTIEDIDALSQDGFSEISTLASMALKLMEAEHTYPCQETIAQVLAIIQSKAQDIKNIINCTAENVGCNYKDEAAGRRYEARRAAELRNSPTRSTSFAPDRPRIFHHTETKGGEL